MGCYWGCPMRSNLNVVVGLRFCWGDRWLLDQLVLSEIFSLMKQEIPIPSNKQTYGATLSYNLKNLLYLIYILGLTWWLFSFLFFASCLFYIRNRFQVNQWVSFFFSQQVTTWCILRMLVIVSSRRKTSGYFFLGWVTSWWWMP